MQHGIPAVMFITWPDMWYHSSEDTPDKQDPTQYKRAAAVGLGSLAVLATGTEEMAARVVADNLGRGLSRMGESHTKGLGYLADATAATLPSAYRDAKVAIQHQAEIEKAVVTSASVLWTNVDDGKKKTAAFLPLIDQRANALLNEVKAAWQLAAMQRGIPAVEPVATAEEKEAASLMIESLAAAGGGGRGGAGGAGGAGGGRGAGGAAGAAGAGAAGAGAAGAGAAGAPPAAGAPGAAGGRGAGGGGRGNAGGPQLGEEYTAEFSLLLPRKLTVLQLRDFLAGEFTPLPLADVMAVLKAREASGAIKLTPVAPAPAKKK
jgi:hypothetical protein